MWRVKLDGIGEHWGVLFPDGHVAHTSPERGTYITTYDDFAQGKRVTTKKVIPDDRYEEALRRARLAQLAPLPYHATKYNCEMFANYVAGFKEESPQVNGWLLMAGIVILTQVSG